MKSKMKSKMKNIKKNSKLLESKFKYKMKTLKKRKIQKGGLKEYITECSLKDKSTVICTVEGKSSIDNTTTTTPNTITNYTSNSSISFNNKNPLSIKIDDLTFVIKNKFIGDRIKIYYSVNGVNYFTY